MSSSSSSRSATSSATAAAAVVGALVGITGTALFYKNYVQQQPQTGKNGKEKENADYSLTKPSASKCIYLDYNGTTPVHPAVLESMLPYFREHYGNPSSSHSMGRTARQAVDRARQQIARYVLNAPDSIVHENPCCSSIWFTSCGTESDNLAIHFALQCCRANQRTSRQRGQDSQSTPLPHIITSAVEHPAVLACLDALVEKGECTVTKVPVQTDGRVSVSDMIAAIEQQQALHVEVALVTLMLANNETGALQPVKQVAEYCRSHGILFHTDAAQAVGKVSTDLVNCLGDADMVSLVGHKMGGPKGIACLYVRPGCWQEHGRSLASEAESALVNHGVVVVGMNQEFGRRAGTLNVPYIVGMGAAAVLVHERFQNNNKAQQHMENLRSRMIRHFQEAFGSDRIRVNGPDHPNDRLPNTLSIGIAGICSGTLLAAVSDRVAASAGATCHSSTTTAGLSPVLKAMQVPPEFARGTLRLSVGPTTTQDDVDRACAILIAAAKEQLLLLNT